MENAVGSFLNKVIIATGNVGKYKEFKAMLESGFNFKSGGFAGEIIFAPDFAKIKVDEDGRTYADNALKKARAWAEASGLPCIADDSGLEVDALNGAPGVYSARIVDGDDNSRNQWLLDKLKNFNERSERRARFVANIALVVPNDFILISEGKCEGFIAEKITGSNGFGYDPLFIPAELNFNLSFAELPPETKNKISHRYKALKNMLRILKI